MIDNGEKLPGFTALVDFVEQKVCEMTATVAANPETRKIVDQTLTDVTNTLAFFSPPPGPLLYYIWLAGTPGPPSLL